MLAHIAHFSQIFPTACVGMGGRGVTAILCRLAPTYVAFKIMAKI